MVVFAVASGQAGAEVFAHAREHVLQQFVVGCSSTPRRYFVTKTKWTCRANTHVLPRL